MPETLPLKEVPGDGNDAVGRWPHLGAIENRIEFFHGEQEFWSSRLEKYGSTVFRVNMPPSPPGFSANPVIMLLDLKSLPILFDSSKVEKKDVLLGSYMPSLSFYGGIRPCIFLDPSEERHCQLKSFMMDLIKSNADKWIPEIEKAASEIFSVWDDKMAKNGTAELNSECGRFACNVLFRTIVGRDPAAPGEASLGEKGPFYFQAWLGPQVAPVASVGLPHVLEETMMHSFPIPHFTIAHFHQKLVDFIETYATDLLDKADKEYGIERNDALHNLIFTLGFNAFGGLLIFLPSLLGFIGRADESVRKALVSEIRNAVEMEGGEITVGAVHRMDLVKSVVYESLRMRPPVHYLYARAKEDLVVESYDARYAVKKGEVIGGCLPFASRDPRVFEDADTFVASRFAGAEGRKLLHHVLWSNGHSDVLPSPHNKQCAAADFVPFLCQTFLACFFLRYDDCIIDEPKISGSGISYTFTSLKSRANR
ncbi:hypothetical protein KP509_03G030100 [Ceratopteris richardii]|uniref:Uncharacterized protein n=1 Tax=Ceratopteris richardii TaxID=49495 RepID=A0A8T2V668_CERRI|nr:hypothetical protein KP509_03G030100 [Ceratopteris richardii]